MIFCEKHKFFFFRLNLPTIATKQQTTLNAPISRKEVLNAVKTLKNGKTPGPDVLVGNFIFYFIYINLVSC